MINPTDVAKIHTKEGKKKLPPELVEEVLNNKGDDEEGKEEE